MSGILLRTPARSIGSTAIALPGDAASGSAPRAPALSLALSGLVHAGALALFLVASARSGSESDHSLPIRVLLQPPIAVLTLEPLRLNAGSAGRPAERGIFDPIVDRMAPYVRESDFVTPASPIDAGAPVGASSPGHGPEDAAPGVAAVIGGEPGDSDLPSLYDAPPVPVVAPEPRYPDWAREAGIEGRVLLEALVARDGRVLNVRVKEGEKGLSEEAVKAVRAWKFRPARWNGKPVAAWVAIPILFRLH